VLAATFLWTYGFGFVIPLFILAAVALWLVIPIRSTSTSNGDSGFSRDDLTELRSALRRPTIVSATAALILGLVVWQAFTSFYPTYLIEEKGLSATVASLLLGRSSRSASASSRSPGWRTIDSASGGRS